MNDESTIILDYLQGNLSANEEAGLFTALSYNEELREQFRNFVAIDKSLLNTSVSFIPPAGVTNTIFTQLGVKALDIGSIETVSSETSHLFFKSKFFASLMTGIVSTVITFVLMSNLMGTPKNNLIVTKTSQIPSSSDRLSKSSINANNYSNTFRSDKNIGNKVIYDKSVQKQFAYKTIQNKEKQIPSYTENSNYSTALASKIPLNIEELDNPGQIPSIESNIIPVNFNNPEIQVSDDVPTILVSHNKSGIELEIKSSAVWNLPRETIYPGEIAKFNNMDLNIFYKLSGNFSIGAGIKQETFYVKYRGTDVLGVNYIKEQQPNFTTYNALLRFFPFEMENMEPFAQISIGGCNYGAVFRTGLGCEYVFDENISAVAMIDYSLLGYYHLEIFNSAQKIGFYYGINYKF